MKFSFKCRTQENVTGVSVFVAAGGWFLSKVFQMTRAEKRGFKFDRFTEASGSMWNQYNMTACLLFNHHSWKKIETS